MDVVGFILLCIFLVVLYFLLLLFVENKIVFLKFLKVILDVYMFLFIGDVFLIIWCLERDGFIF